MLAVTRGLATGLPLPLLFALVALLAFEAAAAGGAGPLAGEAAVAGGGGL